MKRAWMPAVLIAAAGCTVGPDYQPPEMDLPGRYPDAPPAAPGTPPAGIGRWWKVFNDSKLDEIMGLAIESNFDLRIAGARVLEARAQRGVTAAGQYPDVNSSASYERYHTSANALPPPPPGALTPPLGVTGNLYQAGFDASWELDIFGGVRRAVEAADRDIDAAQEDRRDVLVTLMGEVAENYVELRTFQAQMAIARRNVQAQERTLALTESRQKQGIASELDVVRARAQVATTESSIPLLETAAQRAIRRLGLLTGREPMTLWGMLAEPQELSLRPPDVPLGLPADLLRRRPDIRRAERRLASATARIGVATADLYPKLSLTGAFGLQSATSGKFFDWASRAWTIGPTLVWPVFDAGRIRSNIRVQDAQTEQALLRYESTVLASIGEVEDSLTAYRQEQLRRASQARAVDSNRQASDLSNQLYAQGLIDFLSVLQAQRDLYVTEDQLAQSARAVSSDLIALYKALGGGWEELEQD